MRKAPVVLAVLASLTAIPVLAIGNSGGAPSGYTGSPVYRNGDTCTRCHLGTVNSGPASIKIEVPSATYAPGSIIPVTVMFSGTLQNPTKNGYQIVAVENGKTFAAPGWTLSDPVNTRTIAGHLMQTTAGTALKSWQQYFKTPTTATGFTMWAAGNDGDGGRTNLNDDTYTTSVVMNAGSVPLSIDGAALPRIGATVTLNLDSAADPGRPYLMAASLGNAGIPAGQNRRIPLSIDPLLLATVNSQFPFFQRYQGTLDTAGKATAAFVVPNLRFLAGVTLHHAFFVLDPSRPFSIGTISNPLPITLF